MELKIGKIVKTHEDVEYRYTNTFRCNWVGKIIDFCDEEEEVLVKTIKTDEKVDIDRTWWIKQEDIYIAKEVVNK